MRARRVLLRLPMKPNHCRLRTPTRRLPLVPTDLRLTPFTFQPTLSSLFDPGLCPPGKHVVHIYCAANEPWEPWEGMDRRSDEYLARKKAAAEPLWKVRPTVDDRTVHSRFE